MAIPALGVQIQRKSLVDSVYETLLDAIVSGQLPAGSELNSVELARQFEVSRTPVKEALRLLAHDALVEQVTNHKARVVRFTRQDVIEIYEIRCQLESAAAEKAAGQIDSSVLRSLHDGAQELLQSRDAVDWAERMIEYDIGFHDAVAKASGNKRLRKEIGRYRLFVRGFCRMTGHEGNLREALREHVAVLDALRLRDPVFAREAMTAHVKARLRSVLADVFDAAESPV